jgi:hypothetical protein
VAAARTATPVEARRHHFRQTAGSSTRLPAPVIILTHADAQTGKGNIDNPHHRLLAQFGRWRQLPRLSARARARPFTAAARRFASEQFTHAEHFLDWLDQRDHNLAHATQDDIDAWHAQAREPYKRTTRAFLTWAIEACQRPKLALPPLRKTNTGQRHPEPTPGAAASDPHRRRTTAAFPRGRLSDAAPRPTCQPHRPVERRRHHQRR